MAELLRVLGLHAGYDAGTVLEGLDLSLDEGESLAVLGRNGVGKTTLAKTLMGLVPARKGEISFAGRSLNRASTFEIVRMGLGYVPQGRDIFSDMSVEENLAVGDRFRAGNEAAYALFPALSERRSQNAGSLSGGQQQQLAIARTLLTRPRLLILDEPTEGVQPSVIGEIVEALKTVVARDGLSLILIEQNIDMALSLCSRAAFIDHGRVVASETAARLLAEPGLVEDNMGF